MPPASPSTALVVVNSDGATAPPPEEEEIDLPLDLSQLPMIPMPKTLLLVNNFVANTTRFLNHFANECEERISRVSTNLTRVEIMLAILEAKLDSIPDLTVTESDIEAVDAGASPATATPGIQFDREELPPTEGTQGIIPPPPPPPPSSDLVEASNGGARPPPPPPPPPPSTTALVVAAASELEQSADNDQDTTPAVMKLKDDPLYAKYFTMRRLGMPDEVIEHKLLMDGVDPNILNMDPEGPSPSGASAPSASPTGPPPLPIAAQSHEIVASPTGSTISSPRQGPSTPLPPPPPPLPPFSPASSTSSRGRAESLFGDGPPPPPPPLSNPPLPPPTMDDDDSSSDDDDESEQRSVGGFLKLRDDPVYSKYFAMQKMGLPEGAIRHKLLMDGVTIDILSMDPDGPSPTASTSPANLRSMSSNATLIPPPSPPIGERPGLPPPPVARFNDSDGDSDFDSD